MKYAVIGCVDREIYIVGTYDDELAAQQAMEDEYCEVLKKEFGGLDEDDFDDDEPCGNGNGWAWVNGSSDYDWQIVKIEV